MMLDKHLVSTFVQLGLSVHEAGVYLAALTLGPATVIDLAEKSEVKRTTVYTVVQSLLEKGLMTVEVKGLKRRFVAEHPSKLETVLDARKYLLQNTLKKYESAFTKRGGDNSVRYYQGLAGMRTAYTALLQKLKHSDFYYAVSEHKQWYELDPEFLQAFIEKRGRLKINIQLLLVDSENTQRMKQFEKNFNQRVKILSKTTPLTTNLIITPHQVIIHQLVKPIMVFVIENQNIITMHKEMFEIMWNALPE